MRAKRQARKWKRAQRARQPKLWAAQQAVLQRARQWNFKLIAEPCGVFFNAEV